MKIGILTFHFAINYGAVVQAYALQEALKGLGHDVKILNYQSFDCSLDWLSGWRLSLRKKGEFNFFGTLKNKLLEFKKVKRYESFRIKNLSLSEKVSTLDELKGLLKDFDAVVVGSDQVWNRQFSLQTYLLPFLKDDSKIKKVSYAACVGSDKSFDNIEDDLLSSIHKFDLLSVRNKFSQDLVYKKTGLLPEIVCDPTLLIDWNQHLTGSDRIIPYDYIFMYGYRYDEQEIVAYAKKKLKLPVVSVGMGYEYCFSESDKIIPDAGPVEWLNLMKHASFIITKSFHGMMFGLKYQKRFLITNSPYPQSLRLCDAAKDFGVEERLIGCFDAEKLDAILNNPINYNTTNKLLQNKIDSSISFLKKI